MPHAKSQSMEIDAIPIVSVSIPVPHIFDPNSFSARATLRVHGESGATITEVIDFLCDLRHAYAGIAYVIDMPVERLRDEVLRRTNFDSVPLGRFEEPILAGATFNSPGFWDFLAKLNPLSVICDFLKIACDWRDRAHERTKDQQYRNRADEQRLMLENALLENKVIAERIDMLRSMQIPNEDILRWFSTHAGVPLSQLSRHTNSRLLTTAELIDDQSAAA